MASSLEAQEDLVTPAVTPAASAPPAASSPPSPGEGDVAVSAVGYGDEAAACSHCGSRPQQAAPMTSSTLLTHPYIQVRLAPATLVSV